jgi:hypothetical protein
VLLLFWLVLLENTFSFGVLFSLGSGFDLKFSLLIRVFIIISTLDLFFKGKMLKKFIKPITYLALTMIFFLIYGYLLFPQYLSRSLSVTIQTLSILLIIPFLYYENSKSNGSIIFLNQLRIFALFNAICVIVSYLYPNLFEFFESSSSNSLTSRSFGIMGDEIAIFLTFFIIDAIYNQFWKSSIVFTISLLLTGSIGASFTFICALIYYLYNIKYLSVKNFSYIILIIIITIIIIIIYGDNILQLTLFKRIDENLFNLFGNSANNYGNSAKLRFLSINTGLESISKYPFMGLGFGIYGAYIADSFKHLSESEIWIISSTYNQYLQVICEMGVIGLLFYLNFILKSIKNIKPKYYTDYNIVVYSWLVAFFITVQTAAWFLPSSYVYFLVISLISIGLIRKKNERISI